MLYKGMYSWALAERSRDPDRLCLAAGAPGCGTLVGPLGVVALQPAVDAGLERFNALGKGGAKGLAGAVWVKRSTIPLVRGVHTTVR